MKIAHKLLGLGLALICLAAGAVDQPLVRLAANDWPPYISQALPSEGLAGAFVGAVFERMGDAVQVDYYPWKRTMELGLHNPRYAGFLAVWRTPEREKLCHFSSPIGNTLTVLAYLKDTPVQASALPQLKGMRIGTVAGYANGEQFDALVQARAVEVEEGVDDDTNVRKLLMRRFPAILIEKRVLRHLLMGRGYSRSERERIAVVDTLFKERPVHVCFQRNGRGLELQQAFNEAAREVDFTKAERDYWRRIGDDALPPSLR